MVVRAFRFTRPRVIVRTFLGSFVQAAAVIAKILASPPAAAAAAAAQQQSQVLEEAGAEAEAALEEATQEAKAAADKKKNANKVAAAVKAGFQKKDKEALAKFKADQAAKRERSKGGVESSEDDETKAAKAKKSKSEPEPEPEYENEEEYEDTWDADWAHSWLSAAQLHYFTDTVESVDPVSFEIKKAVKLGEKGRSLFSAGLLQHLIAFGLVKGQ